MIKLFADGADFDGIVKAADNEKIVGFTTNPTLMKQAGVTDYQSFALDVIEHLSKTRPETSLSLEVFADDLETMNKQALLIDSWGKRFNYQVYVKIPVTTTDGTSTAPLYRGLSDTGVCCNVTAVFTQEQVKEVCANLNLFVPGIVSIFSGRIADAGYCPEESMKNAVEHFSTMKNNNTKIEFLWASSREPFNFVQAERSGADIITMPYPMIEKMQSNMGKDLTLYSLETVKMFYNDALASGFNINC